MLKNKIALENGLTDLLSSVIGLEKNDSNKDNQSTLDISKIYPNKSQPRINFKEEEMAEMVNSVIENGILQPVLVRPDVDRFELIAGERRWRAAKKAGLTKVPAVIMEVSDQKSMELALIENLQREDLNPIEKAISYKALINSYKSTQEDLAKRLSIDRSSVANTIRLLELPEEIQKNVSRGTVSMGHARALLAVKDKVLQKELCDKIGTESLSVRQLEALVTETKSSAANKKAENPKGNVTTKRVPLIDDLEDKLRRVLKTKVVLAEKKGKGKLTIEFYSNKQLEGILKLLGVSAFN